MLAVIQEECVAVARLCSDIEDMPKQLIEWYEACCRTPAACRVG